MMIAIPLSAGRLSGHFGHCEEFALVDADPGSGRVTGGTRVVPPPHEPGLLPRWLHGLGVEAIIAAGMGRRALDLFTEHGISVCAAEAGAEPERLAQALLAGTLGDATPTCSHGRGAGGHHGCNHPHHHGEGH